MSKLIQMPHGWKLTSLGAVVNNKTKKADSSIPVPIIDLEHLEQETGRLILNSWQVDYPKDKVAFEEGDILFGKLRPYLKKFWLCTFPGACTSELLVIQAKKSVDCKYIYYVLHTDSFMSHADRFSYGTKMPRVSMNDLKSFALGIPENQTEQHRIAKILSTIDRAIEASEKLIAKEKQIKKGLMNDLLTHGIDDHSRIRTPQTHRYQESELGMIPEGWAIGNVKLLVKNLDSHRVPIKEADRQDMNGQYPYYGASGVIDWVNDYLFDGDFILLGEDGENVISRVLPLAFKASGKIWVNNHAHVFKPLDGVDIDYVVSLLESTDYKRIINGSAQPKITQDGLERIQFRIAPKQEQKRIAKVLIVQDKKIETEEANLAKLGALKKGLMDDLLSGRMRVKA